MLETQFSFQVKHAGDPNAMPAVTPTTTTFGVLTFEGEERISQPFEYRLVLSLSAATIDFEKVVNQEATLTMKLVDTAPNPDVVKSTTVVNGIVSDFRVTEKLSGGNLKCEAVLVPKLWRLGLFHRSRVFQQLSIEKIIDKLLGQDLTPPIQQNLDAAALLGGAADAAPPATTGTPALVKGTDYDFAWEDPKPYVYPVREFVMQYQETDLAFLHRLIEDIGIYYFYDGGKLIFTDVKSQHPDVEGTKEVVFAQPSGMSPPAEDRVYRFVSNERVVPKTVSMRDHDYESFFAYESKNMSTGTDGDYSRVGTYAEHGHFSVEKRGWTASKGEKDPDPMDPPGPITTSEANRTTRLERVALVRAEELEAQRRKAEGLSNVTRLQAGHVFTLSSHFMSQSDGDYLVTAVRHRYGHVEMKEAVTIRDMNGVDHVVERTVQNLVYENEFTSLPVAVQYRPSRITPTPRIPGIMTARVKGTGNDSNNEAYLDEEGRYHVEMPFDPVPEGGPYKGGPEVVDPSRPLRLAQPYAGKDYGIHFPNRDNVEMVFACLDGDPNRPIGLGVVPDPWNHTPVPNTRHNLTSQVPIAGDLTAVSERPEDDPNTPENESEGGYYGDDFARRASSPFYFDELKNVIRTKVGHQIVMDDNDGGANIGITIQTGTTDPSGETGAGTKNKYWFTKMELGGYRVKSGAEQIVDGITEVAGYLTTLATRDLMEHVSLGLAIGASVAEAGDYLIDTYGNTTPVGVNIRTNQAVSINGANGVNITSPNLFGMFSNAFVGDEKQDRINQHYLELITKTLNSLVFQSVASDLVSEYKEYNDRAKENVKKEYGNPRLRSFFKLKAQVKKARVRSWALTLLQRSGVNISSAGELKLSSLVSASLVAGLGGVAIKSQGNIEQASKGTVEIDSNEGISISTKGRSYTKDGAVSQALDTLATVFPPLVAMIKLRLGSKMSKKKSAGDTFPLALSNESGDITFHTEFGGDIHAFAGGSGNIINLVENGYHLTRSPEKIVSEVGYKNEKPDEPIDEGEKDANITMAASSYAAYQGSLDAYNKALEAWKDSPRKMPKPPAPPDISRTTPAIGSRIEQTEKAVDVFGKEEIKLSTDKEASESYIKIDKDDQIELKCGQSSLILKKDGTITLKGKRIKMSGSTNIMLNGKDIVMKAQSKAVINGSQVAVNAKTKATFGGKAAVAIDSSGVLSAKGTLVKIG